MFRRGVLLLTALLFSTILLLTLNANAGEKDKPVQFQYPEARKAAQVDDYHGTKVADPYRWLEDADSPETRAWVDAENKLTFGYLEQIPERKLIKDRLTKLWNYERYTDPVVRGGRYFYSRNNGLQNQNVLYWADSLNGEPHLLLDPNTLSSDGTIALSGESVSDDGKLFAYSLSSSGSDWQEWRIREVATGKDRTDVLNWSKFSEAAWTKDNAGIFYERFAEPKSDTALSDTNYFQKVYYHRIGTPQSEDVLVYERPDNKELGFHSIVSDDGAYLLLEVTQGTDRKNRLYYRELPLSPNKPMIKLLDNFDAAYHFHGNVGPVFYLQTDLDASRGRVIAIDVRHPEREHWKTIVPESVDTIENVSLVGDRLIVNYLHDAHSVVKLFSLQGQQVGTVELPGLGSVTGFAGKREQTETFYTYTSFTTPRTVFRYDLKTGSSSIFRQPKIDFDPNAYEVKQVFYTSKDGTRIPMFLAYKKGVKLNGNNPTLLYGYGGFNVSLPPAFSTGNLVWMEMGGIYAQANLRGGAEYGEEWHKAGTKLQKQNVFDDFISAAEWLIANKYTSTPKLAISGRSNGGLPVGACMTQRPDLFGATLPGVGVMDMLRFQKFTIGWAWTSDYGSSDDAEQFRAIYKYSPLHNIKPGTKYPPTLIVTADHDDRVVPLHSFKFAAAMQAAQAGDAPVLIRIETKAGHGAGKPVTKAIEEIADEWTFLVKNLHMSQASSPHEAK